MVAIVSSIRAGLELGSRELLGQAGVLGNPAHGRNGQGVYVNTVNGQLVVQVQDELLVARGDDLPALRTYNSAGFEGDDNGDGWSSGMVLLRLSGTLNAAGSRVSRTAADGSCAIYDFDAARNLYVTTEGAGAHDTIAWLAGSGQFEWRDGATGTVERFEGAGQYRLLWRRDLQGNELAYAYGANGFLSAVTTASGESVHYDYTGNNLTQVRTVTGGTTSSCVRYAYDASNRLATVTVDLSPADGSVADGKVYETRYEYEGASKRLASVMQSDGSNRAFTWVDVGGGVHKLETMRDPLGRVTRFAYGTSFATVTDPLGLVTRYDHDAAGRLTRVTTPAVAGTAANRQFAWDGQGNLVSSTDGEGRTTSYAYDAQGNQVLERDAAGNTVTRSFDARNQLLTESVYTTPDPDGAGTGLPGGELTTRNVYDAGGRNLLRFVLSPGGGVTEHRYDGFGQRVATVRYAGAAYAGGGLPADPASAEATLVAWTVAQDLTRTQRVDYAYDGRGQLQTRTTYAQVGADGLGLATGATIERHVRDAAGRLLQVVSPTAGMTQYTYDGLGRLVASTDALGHSTLTQYDDANRTTVVKLASGLWTVDLYDAADRLVSATQYGGGITWLGETRYFHDTGNRLRMTQDPTGVRHWMLYDEAGRKTADIDGNGTMVEYTYDRRDLVIAVTTYGTAVNTALLIDGAGQPVTSATAASVRPVASSSDQTAWRQYDAAGRLVREAIQTVGDTARVREMRYDGASRLVQTIRYASVISTLSSAGQVAAGQVALPPTTSQDRIERQFHDAEGRLAGSLDAEGYLTVYRYTAAGQLCERIAHATATSQALRTTGTLAQLTPAASGADVRELTMYDAQGRVMAVVDGENYLTETIHDAAGNATQVIRYANRLPPGWSASNVAPGSLAGIRPTPASADQVTTRSYDALNRLLQETSPEGVVTQYGYDALGHLVSTTRAMGTGEVRTLLARYDVQGRLTGELSAQGAALLTGGQTQAQVDAIWAQHGSTHAYDAASRRISTTDALGHRTLFFYNADGALTHTVNALGEVRENRYDARGRLTESVTYGMRIATTGLTGGLAPASLVSALAAIANAALDGRTSISYTRDGKVAASTDALGAVTASTFNAFGEEIGRQLSGLSVSLVETYSVDRRGLRTGSVSDAGGVNAMTSVVYDAFGRQVRAIDANGNLHERSHDRLGREVASTDGTGALRTSSYDAFGRVLAQSDAVGRTTTYAYDAASRSMTVTTPEGVVTVTTYTRHGQVQSLQDGNGNVTTYSYDRGGKLVQTATPLNTASSTYDAAGRLIETTDAGGNKVTYSYDAAHRVLTRQVDATGLNLVTRYEYDAKGQQVRVTDANGNITAIEYDRKGQVLKQTVDPAGLNLQTVYSYDARGNVLTVRSPGGTLTQYVYDALGRRVRERVDPAGLDLQRSWTYDGNGNVVSSTDARGATTRYAYDAEDRLVFTVDALGNLRQDSYDAEGRVVRVTAYATPIATAGLTATPTAAQIQALVVSQAAQDVVEHRIYDRDGRLSATVDGTGAVVRFVRDANGNVVTRVAHATRIDLLAWAAGTPPQPAADAAQDETLHTVYDALNRAVFTLNGVGAVTARVFDGNGNVLQSTGYANPIDPATPRTQAALAAALAAVADGGRDATTRSSYDRAGRLTWTVDGTNAVTRRVYDANGNLVRHVAYANAIAAGAAAESVIPAASDRSNGMAYDAANRLVFQVDALKGVTEQVFDADGHVVARVAYANPLGTVPPLDAPGALAGLRSAINASAAADRTSRYAYDAAGRQVLAVDALGAVTETRLDGAGNAVSVTAYANAINVAGLSASVSLAALQALIVVRAGIDRTTLATFDAAGRAVHSVDAMGAVKQYQYDGIGRTTRITRYAALIPAATTNSATAVAAALQPDATRDATEVFSYNAAGLLIASTDALGATETFTYDALGRKLSFVNRKGFAWSYSYDAAGRMLSETTPPVQVTSTALDAAGNMVASGPAEGVVVTRMAYDALGNLLARTEAAGRTEERTTRYEYDAVGRQVKVLHAPVGVYDAAADAITVNGATGVATRTERTESLFTQTFYDGLGNAVANRDVGGAISQKAYDLLGRVIYEVDALGFVTGYSRNAFGEVTTLVRYGAATTLASVAITQAAQAASRARVEAALSAPGVDHAKDRTLLSTYDRAGRLLERIEPTVFVYDATAPTGQQTGSVGRTTRNVYDAFGQLVQVQVLRNAANQWATTTRYFDRAGRETATVDALGYLTLREFDARGNLTASTEYASAVPVGWTTAGHGMPVASSEDRATAYTYDRLDRKTSETRRNVEFTGANGAATRGDLVTLYEYDAVGNQTRVTDPAGNATTTYHDALGRIVAVAAPARSSTVSGASLTPLTVFRRDAHGNVVATIEHANGTASASTASLTAPVASADDRTTYSVYDRLGRAVQTVDAAGSAQHTSYDAYGNVRKQWQGVTGNDGVTRTAYELHQYDQLGQRTSTTRPASTSIYQHGAGITTVSQAQAGNVVEASEYNAFGEVTRKGSQGGREEYFEYDNAGRLWRTNTGDGVDRVQLYDAIGNMTADIRSSGSGRVNQDVKTFANAEAAAANQYARRVDIQYDALGRVTARLEATREEAQGGLAVDRHYTTATVQANAADALDEDGLSLPGARNRVAITWGHLGGLGGGGDLKVHIEYRTAVKHRAFLVESGIWESGPGTEIRSQTSGVLSGEITGTTFDWEEPRGQEFGVAEVTRIVVWKKDVNGAWCVLLDQPPGYGANALTVAAPADPGASVQLMLRTAGHAGDAGWWAAPLTRFGAAYRADASGLPPGNYEYRVVVTPPGEAPRISASGTATIILPALNSIGSGMAYRPMWPEGMLSWHPAGSGEVQTFRYRVEGSGAGWSTLPVTRSINLPTPVDGVHIQGLGAGRYEYELVWARQGENVPHSHATGTFAVHAGTPGYWVDPVGVPNIGGFHMGTANVGGTYGHNDESGNPFYYGGTTVPALVWNAVNATVVQYRAAGGSWVSLPINNDAQVSEENGFTGTQRAPLNGVAPGTYEVRILAGSPVNAQATGTLVVNAQGPGHYTTVQVQVPSYVPQVAYYQPVYETRYGTRTVEYWEWVGSGPIPRLSHYDESGNPVWARDDNGNIIYDYFGQYERRYRPETYAYQVQVGQTPVYARDENGNIIYQTVWTTQTQQQWVPGTTPPPTLTVTTPSYTPGYWVPEVPRHYSVSLTTAPASSAISTLEGSAMSRNAVLDGDSRWLRPTVLQKTDRWGNVTEITDPRAAYWKTTYRYNAGNQMVQQTLPDAGTGAAVTTIQYDQLGRQVAVRDANGNVNRQVYDGAGNLVREVRADGGQVNHAYNAYGERVRTTDALGHVTAFSYDRVGNLLRQTRSQAMVFGVSGSNELVHVATRNLVESWTYDQRGRKLTQTNGNGETLSYRYDLAGNVVETRQPLGQSVRAAHDTQGRKIAEVDANGYAATWSYDYFGQLIGHTDLGGAHYTYVYDHARQLVAQSSTRGQYISYAYDAAGQLKTIRDAVYDKTTSYVYDLSGRKVRERVVQGGVTYQDNHLAYDARGQLRDVADGRAHVVMEYDKVGNRTRVATFVNYQGTGGEANQGTDRYFRYDAMNRQVVVDAVDAAGNIGTQGHVITYDVNGNRTSDTSFGTRVEMVGGGTAIVGYNEDGSAMYGTAERTYTAQAGYTTETYRYDALDRLQSVVKDGEQIDVRYYDGAGRVVQSGPAGALHPRYAEIINQGLTPDHVNGKETRVNRYDANGRLLHQRVLKSDNTRKLDLSWDPTEGFQVGGSVAHGSGYDAAGNVRGYIVQNHEAGIINEFHISHERHEGYAASVTHGSSSSLQPGSSQQHYDANGMLVAITDSTQPANNRRFVNDANGRALFVNQAGHVQRQLIVNGEVLGRYGVGVDGGNPASGYNNNPNFANIVDFHTGYARVSASYPAPSPGAYTIRSGDTLQSIAQGAYGDSALWYRIAEANGLASANDLKVGQTLNIPSGVGTIHNNASTFEPYDPSRIQGDTTPSLATPQPKKGGTFGKLLMVIVAIVVTMFTVGAMGSTATGLLQTIIAGAKVIAGTAAISGVGASIGFAATMAVAGAAGAVASQLVGMATGNVEKFDWKGVALSALSGAIAAKLPTNFAIPGANEVGNAMVRSAVASALTQGVAVATGLQSRFDWRGVAASAVGTGVGQVVGDAIGLPTVARSEGMSVGEFMGKSLITGLAAGAAAAAARGGRVEVQQVAVDAFGNALGQSLADAATSDPTRTMGAGPAPVSEGGGSAGGLKVSQSLYDGWGPRVNVPGVSLDRPAWDLYVGGTPRLSSMGAFGEQPYARTYSEAGADGGVPVYVDSETGAEIAPVRPQTVLAGRALPPLAPIPRVAIEPSAGQYVVGRVVREMDGIRARLDALGEDPSTPSWLRFGAAVARGPGNWIPETVKFFAGAGGYALDSQLRGQVNTVVGSFLANDPIGTTKYAATRYWDEHSPLEIAADGFNLVAGGSISAPFGKLGSLAFRGTVSTVTEAGETALRWTQRLSDYSIEFPQMRTQALYNFAGAVDPRPLIPTIRDLRAEAMALAPQGFDVVRISRGAAVLRHGDDIYSVPNGQYSLIPELRAMDTVGDVFTKRVQAIADSFDQRVDLTVGQRLRLDATPDGWLKERFMSAYKGSYIHNVAGRELPFMEGAAGLEYKTVGPDFVPIGGGPGLRYEVTQLSPSLNAIFSHTKRYPDQLLRYVTYR